VISRLGSVVAAADHLELTPQTLSGQLASLEAQLGGALFHRANRALQLTDFGHTVFSYADEMFKTAQALSDLVSKPAEDRPLRLAVGICASIHKLIAYRLLKPALELPRTVKLRCQTGDLSQLLKCLHQRSLDVILSDRPPADKDAPQVRCEYVVPDKCVYLWVEQPLNVDIATVVRQFVVTFSGDPVPIHYNYVDTAIDALGAEAYHVFEVSGAATGEMLAKGEVHAEPLAAAH
jgi:DNA-binding transcriptional LysR family regulator